MIRVYLEYFTRDMKSPVYKVVTAETFNDALKYLPQKEIFCLPEYAEDGWNVSLSYWEWAEPIKDFMELWYNDKIIEWYKNNLTPARMKHLPPYEPDANKRAWKRFKYQVTLYYGFFLRLIFGFITTLEDMWYDWTHRNER